MAIVFADSEGRIIRFLNSPELVARCGRTMEGAAESLEFDENENRMLTSRLTEEIDSFTLQGGELRYNGNLVPITQDGEPRRAIRRLRQLRQKLKDGTATQAERMEALTMCVCAVLHLMRDD